MEKRKSDNFSGIHRNVEHDHEEGREVRKQFDAHKNAEDSELPPYKKQKIEGNSDSLAKQDLPEEIHQGGDEREQEYDKIVPLGENKGSSVIDHNLNPKFSGADKLSFIANLCESKIAIKGQKGMNNDSRVGAPEVSFAGRTSFPGPPRDVSTSMIHGNQNGIAQMINQNPHRLLGRPNMDMGSSSPQNIYEASAHGTTNYSSTKTGAASSSKKISCRFPVKLMKVLSSGKYDHVISWIPDGKAFVIHNQDELVEKVLPLFDFKGVKYSSFTRKLHRWGFVKILRGSGGDNCHRSAYFHKNFQRDNFALCHEMRCSGKRDDDELLQKYNGGDTIYRHTNERMSYPNELQQHHSLGSISSYANAASIVGMGIGSGTPLDGGQDGVGSIRSIDDNLNFLRAQRELLMINHHRRMLKEEEERKMYATISSSLAIDELNNNPSSLRNANVNQSLLHRGGGLPSGNPTSALGAFLPQAELLGLSESLRAGSLLEAAARRGDPSSLMGGGLLYHGRSGATSIPWYGGGLSPSHQINSINFARNSLNPARLNAENHLRQQILLGRDHGGRGQDSRFQQDLQKERKTE